MCNTSARTPQPIILQHLIPIEWFNGISIIIKFNVSTTIECVNTSKHNLRIWNTHTDAHSHHAPAPLIKVSGIPHVGVEVFGESLYDNCNVRLLEQLEDVPFIDGIHAARRTTAEQNRKMPTYSR